MSKYTRWSSAAVDWAGRTERNGWDAKWEFEMHIRGGLVAWGFVLQVLDTDRGRRQGWKLGGP